MKHFLLYCFKGEAKFFVNAISSLFVFAWATVMSLPSIGQTTVTFNYTGASQTFTIPLGVTELTVELWGAGGAGGANNGAGGGGGGGAYTRATFSVTPLQDYTIVIGQRGVGTSGSAGSQSTFSGHSINLVASGGAGAGTSNAGALGGTAQTVAGIIVAAYAGGNGGNGLGTGANGSRGGGGGGGSATSIGDGGVGGAGAANTSGAGGIGEGNGGDGGNPSGPVEAGVGIVPGGGGGGSYGGTANNGGNGAHGQVKITYTEIPACTNVNITTQPSNATITYGANTSFTVVATGDSPAYQWQYLDGVDWVNLSNAGVYSGVTTATLNLTRPPVSLNSTQYRVVVSNACPSSQNSDAATLTVNAKQLTIGGTFDANNKVYDRNVVATTSSSSLTLNVIEVGDDVTLASIDYEFDNFQVGTGKFVILQNPVLGGDDKDNYTVSISGAPTSTADITPLELTIDGTFGVNNKVYDGSVSATISSNLLSLDGIIAPDEVTLNSVTAQFDNKNVGTGKDVNITAATLAGASSTNYTVTVTGAPQTTANITAKNLTISGAIADDKEYNGNTNAAIDFSGTSLVGVEGADAVGIDDSGYSATFAQTGVGTDIEVTVTGVTLSGADAGNYTVSQPAGLQADIYPKELTITGALANNKVYNGNNTATVNFGGASLDGVVGADAVTINSSGYSATFAQTGVGTDIEVTVTGVALSGADAGNYTLLQPTGLDADITALSVSITGSKIVDGDGIFDAAILTISNIVGADDVSLTGSVTVNDNIIGVYDESDVTANTLGLAGAQSANYTLTGFTLNVNITPGAFVWNGSMSDDFHDPDNWDGGVVPPPGSDIIIPTGLTNYPVFDDDFLMGDIDLDTDATFDVNPGKALKLAPGKSVTGLGKIRLKSDGTGTGRIGELSGGSSIGVSVIQERHIIGGNRTFRFLGHPFNASIPLSALGATIDITGTGGVANGFTPTATNLPSAFYYDPADGDADGTDDGGWKAFTNLNTDNWLRHQGIRVLVRGPKGQAGSLLDIEYSPDPVTFEWEGTINSGLQTITLRAFSPSGGLSDFNLVGNPFPSPIDLGNIGRSASVGPDFYIWQARESTSGLSGRGGAYVNEPFGVSYSLPAGAAFFVRAGVDNETLTIDENHKIDANEPLQGAPGSSLRTENISSKYGKNTLQLRIDHSNGIWDRFLVMFNEEAKAVKDYWDGPKMANPDLNFFTVTDDNYALSIDRRPYSVKENGNRIPVHILGASGNYTLTTPDFDLDGSNVIRLYDRFKNEHITLKQGTSYNFEVSNDPKSKGHRFDLVMGVDVVTSIPNRNSEFKTFVMPNPANEEVLISVQRPDYENKTQLRVVDLQGRVVFQTEFSPEDESNIQMMLNSFRKGLYLIEVTHGNLRDVKRLIVN